MRLKIMSNAATIATTLLNKSVFFLEKTTKNSCQTVEEHWFSTDMYSTCQQIIIEQLLVISNLSECIYVCVWVSVCSGRCLTAHKRQEVCHHEWPRASPPGSTQPRWRTRWAGCWNQTATPRTSASRCGSQIFECAAEQSEVLWFISFFLRYPNLSVTRFFPDYLCWKRDDRNVQPILEGSPDSQHQRQQVQPPVLWQHGRFQMFTSMSFLFNLWTQIVYKNLKKWGFQIQICVTWSQKT